MKDDKTKIDVKHTPASGKAVARHDWDPLASLRHQIDRLMADIDWPDFRQAWPGRLAATTPSWPDFGGAGPAVDLFERNGSYELQAELPGLDEKEIEVKLSDGVMTIKGEKSAERVEDGTDYHLRERSFGSFQRSFRLPAGVDESKIDARFDNGVLKVHLPKSAAVLQTERKIAVKSA